MKKIDYKIPGSDGFLKKVHGYFDGIDEVIKELATEGAQLQNELTKLEGTDILSAELLKKKAEIKQKLTIVKKSLDEALAERRKIQTKNWSKISNEANNLLSEYNQSISRQLIQHQRELYDILDQAEAKLTEIKKIKEKRNSNFNEKIVYQINKIVQEDEDEKKILNPSFFSGTTSLEKIIHRKNGGLGYTEI